MEDWFETSGRATGRGSSTIHERAFERKGLAAGDARWHDLSPKARGYFIDVLKGPARHQADHAPSYTLAKNKVPPEVLAELLAGGFVKILPARTKSSADRVFVPAELFDFATRVRMLARLGLLDARRPGELRKYVDYAFDAYRFLGVASSILRAAGIDDYFELNNVLQDYVTNHRWPAWVARKLKDPLADRILEVLRAAGDPIPVVDLPGRLGGSEPQKVRATLDRLIAHLAVVEGLDPRTSEILVGFLPTVREGLVRAARPSERPPLVVCDRPREIGPDESPIASDLRAFLFEVASEPPRLRQVGSLFQKEFERFTANLEPLPAWLLHVLEWSDEGRLNQALAWARSLELVEDAEGDQLRLRLSAKGHRWLSGGLDAQYAGIYQLLNGPAKGRSFYVRHARLFASGPDEYDSGLVDDVALPRRDRRGAEGDEREVPTGLLVREARGFRGVARGTRPGFRVAGAGDVLPAGQRRGAPRVRRAQPAESGARPGAGGRHPQPSAHPEPGGAPRGSGPVAGRVLRAAAADPTGRRPGGDGRGRGGLHRARAAARRLLRPQGGRVRTGPAGGRGARVVVQPDFSVILIGLNPTAAAELAPFCERATGGGGRGAMILKITRDSVVRAVGNGLKSAEIADRLRRHASNEVPANVLREVQDWSSWVRHVVPATLSVLQCPDRDTADRVESALKRQATRLNETLVAIDLKLTAAERAKLRTQGIIIQPEPGALPGRPKAKTRKKGRRW